MFHDIFEINNDQCAKNKCLYSQLISDMVAEIIVGIYQSQRTLFSLAQWFIFNDLHNRPTQQEEEQDISDYYINYRFHEQATNLLSLLRNSLQVQEGNC